MKFKKYLKLFLVIAVTFFVFILAFAEISKIIMVTPVSGLSFIESILSFLFFAGSLLLMAGVNCSLILKKKTREKINTVVYIMIISALCCFLLTFATYGLIT